MSKKILLTFFALIIITADIVFAAQKNVIRIHGSNTIAKQVFELHAGEIKSKTNVDYTTVGNGSSRGLEDINNGKADIAMISTSLDELQKRLKDVPWEKLSKFYIGSMKVAFVVNSNNPVSNLTLQQLAAIFSGKITNWAELGGENEEIVVVAEYYGGGVRSTVEKRLLNNDPIEAKLVQTNTVNQVERVVKEIPAAIGIMNLDSTSNIDGVKLVKTDREVMLSFHLLTFGQPSPEQQSIISAVQALNLDNSEKDK